MNFGKLTIYSVRLINERRCRSLGSHSGKEQWKTREGRHWVDILASASTIETASSSFCSAFFSSWFPFTIYLLYKSTYIKSWTKNKKKSIFVLFCVFSSQNNSIILGMIFCHILLNTEKEKKTPFRSSLSLPRQICTIFCK